jgi:hypothetical protein
MIEVFGTETSLVEKCSSHFCKVLGINSANISILTDEIMETNGACYQNTIDDYMIVLKVRPEYDMIQTLAHELVHVKQFIQNNLAEYLETNEPYYNRWWEIEAYAKESELMQNLIQEITKGNLKL